MKKPDDDKPKKPNPTEPSSKVIHGEKSMLGSPAAQMFADLSVLLQALHESGTSVKASRSRIRARQRKRISELYGQEGQVGDVAYQILDLAQTFDDSLTDYQSDLFANALSKMADILFYLAVEDERRRSADEQTGQAGEGR